MNFVSNVGKVILSKNKEMKGIVTHEISRFCAICKTKHRCYIVKWDDGSCTKPCEKAIVPLDENRLIIQ